MTVREGRLIVRNRHSKGRRNKVRAIPVANGFGSKLTINETANTKKSTPSLRRKGKKAHTR